MTDAAESPFLVTVTDRKLPIHSPCTRCPPVLHQVLGTLLMIQKLETHLNFAFDEFNISQRIETNRRLKLEICNLTEQLVALAERPSWHRDWLLGGSGWC